MCPYLPRFGIMKIKTLNFENKKYFFFVLLSFYYEEKSCF